MVGGLYRHVRNPMYVAVAAILVGEALLLGSLGLLAWAVAGWLTTDLFVRLYEEPTLGRTFGAEYTAYTAAVPRWLPRLTQWRPDAAPTPANRTSSGGPPR